MKIRIQTFGSTGYGITMAGKEPKDFTNFDMYARNNQLRQRNFPSRFKAHTIAHDSIVDAGEWTTDWVRFLPSLEGKDRDYVYRMLKECGFKRTATDYGASFYKRGLTVKIFTEKVWGP